MRTFWSSTEIWLICFLVSPPTLSFSNMLRTTALRTLRTSTAQAPLGRRMVHIDNVVGNNTPFSYANPKALAVKMIAFCGFGFSIPFLASAYQIHKASA